MNGAANAEKGRNFRLILGRNEIDALMGLFRSMAIRLAGFGALIEQVESCLRIVVCSFFDI